MSSVSPRQVHELVGLPDEQVMVADFTLAMISDLGSGLMLEGCTRGSHLRVARVTARFGGVSVEQVDRYETAARELLSEALDDER